MANVDWLDVSVFITVTILISLYGTVRARIQSHIKRTAEAQLIGQDVSLFWVALSVCSTYISAISILGFPAEVYYRGTMMYYYLLMYAIAYPLCAYIFLPVLYELKLKTLYEYLERRFSLASRIIASATFAFQTLLYESAALYAPALALTSLLPIPNLAAIIITASLSAIYLFIGGARAGMFTASLQMILIFASLFLICVAPLFHWDAAELFANVKHGGRLIFDDFRLDPRIRHSALPLILGGTGNILSLYATNQLTLQRYICLPTLKKAQRAIVLNIPMNGFILTTYVLIGLIIYGVYHGCHPEADRQNNLVTNFIKMEMNYIPGIQGIFLAALYSAGVSTLTASYTALTSILIEDVIKLTLSRVSPTYTLSADTEWKMAKFLPIFFAVSAAFFAYLITKFEAVILQIALSIFGGLGGTILGIFCVGLFCPWIKSSISAVCAQISAIIMALIIMIGSFANKVKPVDLPLSSACPSPSEIANLTLIANATTIGTVTSTNNYLTIWTTISEISYQYYSIVGVLVCLIVSHVVEIFVCIFQREGKRQRVDDSLLSKYIRFAQSRPVSTEFDSPKWTFSYTETSSKL